MGFPNIGLGTSPSPAGTDTQPLVRRDAQQTPNRASGEGREQIVFARGNNETEGIPPEREHAARFLRCCSVDVQAMGKALPPHGVLETLPLLTQCHMGSEAPLRKQRGSLRARALCRGL